MVQQAVLLALLALALALFVWGRWRHDVVALVTLLAAVVAGVVPGDQAFRGFGDPAVVTVAAVLVMSRALQESGAVDHLSQVLLRPGASLGLQAVVLTGLVTALSSFMNNVGALALVLPLAVRLARKEGVSPSFLLMPLAFGSLLGGTVTLIGTPPNIILSDFRAAAGAGGFGMFDFAPVGVPVAVAGTLFLCLFGRRLVPDRPAPASQEELFHMGDYLSEVRVAEGSPFVGQTLRDLGWATDEEILVLSLVREGESHPAPPSATVLHPGDLLVVEADPRTLGLLSHAAGLELKGSRDLVAGALASEEVSVVEAVVGGQSPLVRRTARELNLRGRHGVNVLGVARAGRRLEDRVGNTRFRAGDVLLLQGATGTLAETLHDLGCLPLSGPGLRLAPRRGALTAALIFGAAIGVTAAGLLPVQVSFVGAAVAMVVARLVPLREAYESIDWSVVVLLGAMIPVGHAMETTGAAQEIAGHLVRLAGQAHPGVVVAGLLMLAMTLSNVMNNAATAVVMAPIALGIAAQLGLSADPFLMAVAIGSSAAFLTPIGHQSNTLVMGPGGYRFGDYWRLGLPLSLLVAAAAVPTLLWWWPLAAAPF
ncbi:MAG: SLC13 family permease [Deferrisomatales bacterium]